MRSHFRVNNSAIVPLRSGIETLCESSGFGDVFVEIMSLYGI